MVLTADFTWPAIFTVNMKTQLYGYLYCKDKYIANFISIGFSIKSPPLCKRHSIWEKMVLRHYPLSHWLSSCI